MSVDAEVADLWNTLSGAALIQAMADGTCPEISDVNRHIGQVITQASAAVVPNRAFSR